jgi:catechol 2,3-dioxygenase-like lactoylglutathione lyase family enzyme
MHHASIRTANIHRAIAFYEQLGFTVSERFTAGITLACWMEGLGGRIELIQIPEPRPAPDAFGDEHYVGYYHLSFDITAAAIDLPTWLTKSARALCRSVPEQPDRVSSPENSFGTYPTDDRRSRLRSDLYCRHRWSPFRILTS